MYIYLKYNMIYPCDLTFEYRAHLLEGQKIVSPSYINVFNEIGPALLT
jgi:hypothetical protein